MEEMWVAGTFWRNMMLVIDSLPVASGRLGININE